ncbi:MAG: RNA polymerase sigma-54 factor RpoN, partial [uncultured Segetibacter sp.]
NKCSQENYCKIPGATANSGCTIKKNVGV